MTLTTLRPSRCSSGTRTDHWSRRTSSGGESWTFLRKRSWHAAAVSFLDALARTPRVQVRFLSRELEERALSWLRQHDEREYSFVDATSFAVMRSLRIQEALAFDGDFAAAGFVELRA